MTYNVFGGTLSLTQSINFTLSVTVMLLLTDLTSAPDDKSIGVEYC